MTVSNRRLALFLALAIAPVLVLALGPFRDRFFPSDVAALRALARVESPPLDEAAWLELAGPTFSSPGDRAWLAELASAADGRRFDEIVRRLDALPADRITPGLMYAHGVAALLADRPAVALSGLEAARHAADPELAQEAGFALAQAFLLLDRGDAARALLRELAAGSGARAAEAAAQLAALNASR